MVRKIFHLETALDGEKKLLLLVYRKTNEHIEYATIGSKANTIYWIVTDVVRKDFSDATVIFSVNAKQLSGTISVELEDRDACLKVEAAARTALGRRRRLDALTQRFARESERCIAS